MSCINVVIGKETTQHVDNKYKERIQEMNIVYLFITDKNCNYVFLRKTYKGVMCPFITIPEEEHDQEKVLEFASRRMKLLFGNEEKHYVVDKITKPNCSFLRVILASPCSIAVDNRSDTHVWYDTKLYGGRRINSMIENHINSLKLQSSVVSAGCLVLSKDREKILLVKGKLSNKYGIPKGHMMPCEEPEDAAIRETMEETGISIDRSSIVSINSVKHKKTRVFMVEVDYDANEKPKTNDSHEIIDVAWFPRKSIGSIPITNLTKSLLSWCSWW